MYVTNQNEKNSTVYKFKAGITKYNICHECSPWRLLQPGHLRFLFGSWAWLSWSGESLVSLKGDLLAIFAAIETTALLPTADVAVDKASIKCVRYWKVESIYQCLCCFPSPSKFPYSKNTTKRWLFNTCYCKIHLLNRNPIEENLSACWRHPVPPNWPLDPQFRAASLPQYWC